MIKRLTLFLVLGSLVFITLAEARPVTAQSQTPVEAEPYAGLPLCQPGAYLADPQDCIPLGPSSYITQLAEKGITYPFLPIMASSPDPDLNNLDLRYARINVPAPEQAPIYNSYDDAISGGTPATHLKPGNILYVSYSQRADNEGNSYVYLRSGGWMRASPGDSQSKFQGLLFQQNPTTGLGWMVDTIHPRVAPGYQSAESSVTLNNQSPIQIYDVQVVDQVKWYMVDLNQWVERRYIRQLEIDAIPPQGITSNRWIDVNLYEQTLAVYENGKLLFATLIASGMEPYYTRPGLFQIYMKKPTETMSGGADSSEYYYLEDVPWTMYFDEERAIHGAYWRALFGYEQSHGCVNMSIGDARWVYDWANEGDYVYVHDPSGLTPTDPALYANVDAY